MFNKIKEKMGGLCNRLFSLKKEDLSKLKEKLFKDKDCTEYLFLALILLATIMILVEDANTEAELKASIELQEVNM